MKIYRCCLLLIIVLGLINQLQAQDCFGDFLKRGIDAYGRYQFQEAIDLFNAAKICPENSEDQVEEIDGWIGKANNGYINEITKARDEALALQKEAVKQARLSEANRLAYLAAEELEKRNIDDALLLAFVGLDMIEEEPLPQVKQIFGNVIASTHARTFKGGGQPVLDSGFLPDGRLWCRAGDQTLTFWRADGMPDTIVKMDGNRMLCSTASSDGSTVAIGFENGRAGLWDASGHALGHQMGMDAAVTDISFAEDGSRLATSYRNGGLKIWSSIGELLAQSTFTSAIDEVQFMANGNAIVIRSATPELKVIDMEAKPLTTIQHSKHIYLFHLSPNQQMILTSSADSTARLSNMDGQTVAILRHPAKVHKAIFSPGGERILTAALDHNIRFWDLTGKLLWMVKGDESIIESIQFSPAGNYFLSFARANVVKLWNTAGQLVANLDRHTGPVTSAAFSPDSKFILTTSADRTAKLWDIEGQLLMNADQYSGVVGLGTFSLDGKRILTASEDGNLTVLENPVDVFRNLQINPPLPTEDQRVRYGLTPTQ